MFHQTNYFEPWNHNEENLFSINPHGKSWNEQRERETRPTFVNNVMYILFVYIIFSAFGVSVWPMITFYCKLLKINKLSLFIKFVLSVIIYFYNKLRFNLQIKLSEISFLICYQKCTYGVYRAFAAPAENVQSHSLCLLGSWSGCETAHVAAADKNI